MPKDRSQLQCSQFCLEQVASCLKVAQLNMSTLHYHMFMRMAAHWNQIAKECDGQVHAWTRWCQKSLDSASGGGRGSSSLP